MSKIFGKLFGETKTSTAPSAFSQLPQFAQQGFQDLVERSQALSQQDAPFAPAQFVPLDPLQQQGIQALGGVRANIPALGLTRGAVENFGRAGGALGRSGEFLGQGGEAITGQEIQSSIGDFFNPFTQQVVDED